MPVQKGCAAKGCSAGNFLKTRAEQKDKGYSQPEVGAGKKARGRMPVQKDIKLFDGTPSGNRTRVSPVAGEYSTTRPTVWEQ